MSKFEELAREILLEFVGEYEDFGESLTHATDEASKALNAAHIEAVEELIGKNEDVVEFEDDTIWQAPLERNTLRDELRFKCRGGGE